MNKSRLLIGLIMAVIAIIGYYSKNQINPITGEKQHIDMSPDQEIALGLQSAPQMAQQHGGLHPDARLQQLVKSVGNKIVQSSDAAKSPYQFDFHVLADPQTINAFALPGGQVFITYALLERLFEKEDGMQPDRLAGVLGHEVGHVIGRHSAEHLAQQQLAGGLSSAAVMATYDPSNPTTAGSQQMAAMISNVVLMKYGREDELESDDFGVKYMLQAGYRPEALITVMKILEAASGGKRQSEFMSTHPSPENRIERINAAIQKYKSQLNAK